MATTSATPRSVFVPKLSRRQNVKAGGALVVGFSLIGPELLKADAAKSTVMKNSLDPTLPSSWIEIHPDNTILIRTGKNDFGQGTTFTAYRQIVADELSVPFEAITTLVQGSTDSTPDGSGSFDFLGRGMPNIRKAAAYTHQALLDLASEKLAVPKDKLSVKDGIVSRRPAFSSHLISSTIGAKASCRYRCYAFGVHQSRMGKNVALLSHCRG